MAEAPTFSQRYRRAVGDAQLQRNLLGFQRGWRQSRADRFAEYVDPQGHSGEEAFEDLRGRLAAAKDVVIHDQARYFARFKAAAEASGAVVYDDPNRQCT